MIHLTPPHRRYLLVKHGLGAAFVNAVINGTIAAGVFQDTVKVTLWGNPGMGGDLLMTSMLLPVITAVITRWVVVADLNSHRVDQLMHFEEVPVPIPQMREWGPLKQGALVGICVLVLIALPTIGVLAALPVGYLVKSSAILFKAIWAACVGMLVTPGLAWLALQAGGFWERGNDRD